MDKSMYVKNDDGFWFTQKSISEILGIKTHTVNYHLKEIEKIDSSFKIKNISLTREEGNRHITRSLKHYSLESFFDISMRCNRLETFNNLLKLIDGDNKTELDFKVRPIKERNFKEILDQSLKDIMEFKYQYRVNGYIVDFYFPQLNLCVEYDECHHENHKDKDDIREKSITGYKDCDFLRVAEGEELQGLNKILKINMQHIATNRYFE